MRTKAALLLDLLEDSDSDKSTRSVNDRSFNNRSLNDVSPNKKEFALSCDSGISGRTRDNFLSSNLHEMLVRGSSNTPGSPSGSTGSGIGNLAENISIEIVPPAVTEGRPLGNKTGARTTCNSRSGLVRNTFSVRVQDVTVMSTVRVFHTSFVCWALIVVTCACPITMSTVKNNLACQNVRNPHNFVAFARFRCS